MHETAQDLVELQALLDASYGSAGAHLRGIIGAERPVGAVELCQRLSGMCLLTVATATADGRPVAGPVDSVFYRGRFYFGSGESSVRLRHLAARPAVSAVHVPDERFAVSVHGRARRIDLADPAEAGFRRALVGVYTPIYGPAWEHEFLDGLAGWYVAIEAEKLFTFRSAPEDPGGG